MTKQKMKRFMTMNDWMPNILIDKEQEPGRRVLGVIRFFEGQIEWTERIFDDPDELIAYVKDYTEMTDADIEEFAKKINRYIDDHTR